MPGTAPTERCFLACLLAVNARIEGVIIFGQPDSNFKEGTLCRVSHETGAIALAPAKTREKIFKKKNFKYLIFTM